MIVKLMSRARIGATRSRAQRLRICPWSVYRAAGV